MTRSIRQPGEEKGHQLCCVLRQVTHAQATVVAGKAAHYALLAAIPMALHGFGAVWPAMATYTATQVTPCAEL